MMEDQQRDLINKIKRSIEQIGCILDDGDTPAEVKQFAQNCLENAEGNLRTFNMFEISLRRSAAIVDMAVQAAQTEKRQPIIIGGDT